MFGREAMVQTTSISGVPRAQPAAVEAVSEETLNQITHGIGLVLSIPAAIHLISQPTASIRVAIGGWVYAIALVLMFAASTLSHSFDKDPVRTRFRTLDQICIFIFMAAIYTPVSLKVCSDGWSSLPLIAMWVMAVVGTWLKLKVAGDDMVSVWFYMAMGAIPMLTFLNMLSGLGTDGMLWVLAAACCYLVGIIFLTNDHKHRYFHPIWHLLVMLGSVCHYIVICNYTLPPAA